MTSSPAELAAFEQVWAEREELLGRGEVELRMVRERTLQALASTCSTRAGASMQQGEWVALERRFDAWDREKTLEAAMAECLPDAGEPRGSGKEGGDGNHGGGGDGYVKGREFWKHVSKCFDAQPRNGKRIEDAVARFANLLEHSPVLCPPIGRLTAGGPTYRLDPTARTLQAQGPDAGDEGEVTLPQAYIVGLKLEGKGEALVCAQLGMLQRWAADGAPRTPSYAPDDWEPDPDDGRWVDTGLAVVKQVGKRARRRSAGVCVVRSPARTREDDVAGPPEEQGFTLAWIGGDGKLEDGQPTRRFQMIPEHTGRVTVNRLRACTVNGLDNAAGRRSGR